jgi:serine/threonine protein kinase
MCKQGVQARPPLWVAVQVLSHIAERLKDLHAAGYVHRDLKPGNIMWLPRKKRWTLIDFGCAARTGTHAPTGFSLFYVAPEALQAYIAGEPGVVAEEALDAWSLGVLAIELFNGRPVFQLFSRQEVRAPAGVLLDNICTHVHGPRPIRISDDLHHNSTFVPCKCMYV